MDEQQKKAIMERRTANQKLSQLIQQGTRYHEALKMKLIDGQEHDVQVYALSENEFRTLLEEFGVELKDFGNKEKMTENMKMVEQLAQVATGQEDIANLALANGCMEIMMKCFEISGLSAAKAPKVESFQPRDIQPQPVRAN